MNHPAAISDNDLHALLDGALDAGRAREVMAEVEADPAMATRLAAFRADKDMLKQIYGPLAAQPVPEEWLKLAQSRRRRPVLSWRMVGSIAAVLLVAAAVGYAALLPSARPSEIVQVALDARQAEGGQTIAVAANGDAGRYADTLSKTVDVPVKVPHLSKMGYRLAAIRLYPKAPAATGRNCFIATAKTGCSRSIFAIPTAACASTSSKARA